MDKQYYAYIMTSISGILYIGVTYNLARRVFEHKSEVVKGFTSRYKIKQLVYYEASENIEPAIQREKQIKGWTREKKVKLINSVNPEWKDLSLEFMDALDCHSEDKKYPKNPVIYRHVTNNC
jgi:putative endonuclease